MLAGRSIRVDTSPLFATEDRPLVPKEAKSPKQRKQDDSKTFSELVNDALDSASATPQKPTMTDQAPSPQSPFSPPRPQTSRRLVFGGVRPAETPTKRTEQLQYDEEMDWSPIRSPHRALNDNATPLTSKFGRTNEERLSSPEAKNPFWCKVPAAPVNPAQRLRNPQWSPAPTKHEPAETGKVMFTRRGHPPTSSQTTLGGDTNGGVEFKQPRFFAPQKDHDASSLADLLSQSFTLGQDQQEEDAETAAEQSGSTALAKSMPQTSAKPSPEPTVLTVLLSAWLLAMFANVPYAWEVRLTTLFMAGVIALRRTGDTSYTLGNRMPGPAAYILSALGAAELAAICWVGSKVWSGQSDQTGLYGVGVLVSMLGHQALRMVL